MAGIQWNLTTTGEVALVAATLKSVLAAQAPANVRLKVLGWGVYFDDTLSTDDPVLTQLVRMSTTGTWTALTPKKVDPSLAESVQSCGRYSASVEPTSSDIYQARSVHPQTGYEHTYPQGQEDWVAGGGVIGIQCRACVATNVIPWIKAEE